MILYTEFNFSDLYIMAIFESYLQDIGPIAVSRNATAPNVYSYNEENQYIAWYQTIHDFTYAYDTYFQDTPIKKFILVDFLWEIL